LHLVGHHLQEIRPFKSTILPQAEAKGSLSNMLVIIFLCLRQRPELLMFGFFAKNNFCEGIHKNKGDCHQRRS
jgi:hypothetical protein